MLRFPLANLQLSEVINYRSDVAYAQLNIKLQMQPQIKASGDRFAEVDVDRSMRRYIDRGSYR